MDKPYIPDDEEIPDWLRKFKGCEHYTDDEARDIYASLGILAAILMRTEPVKVYNSNNEAIASLEKENTANDNQNEKHAA